MQEKRKKWKENIPELPKTKLAFLDESGVNTNLTRQYGRAIGKQWVVDAALLRAVGAIPLYLPPYSPDFNPIEKM